jgi:hypothetical protein
LLLHFPAGGRPAWCSRRLRAGEARKREKPRDAARLEDGSVRACVYNAARTGPQAFDDDDDEIMKPFI